MVRVIQDAQRRVAMGKAADFPTVVVTTAGVSVAAKTGYPVTGLPV